ncbi:MAG: hypothetical protein E7391_04040 [Ruminococcaceae bacterium]|nr:hypothetical protein [Oscillospiraceae bacterium]
MDFESTLLCIVFFAFLGGWRFYEHLKKLHYNQNMFKKVGWIAEKENITMYYDSSVDLRNEELLYYIMQEQSNSNLSKEFRVNFANDSEKKYAEEILEYHRKSVIKSYFSNFLTKTKNICKLNSLEYYLYSLYNFICDELNEYKHNQDKIYENKEWLDETYFTCQLTDYGRTYYKLYLITHLFIIKNEKTRLLFEYINPEQKNNIMKYLQNNEVKFWSYRP